MTGKAYLIGAGPGRADLITVRGLTLLRQAEVVLYDHLIARTLLDAAPPTAERIFVGKGPGRHLIEQAAINELLVARVQAGQQVARLKGGDPFVFGHGGEEALALRQAGLPFEIVPGVTSAVAVPAFAGIPVTQRGMATGFTVVTGHLAADQAYSAADWAALARMPTLIILMGLRQSADICAALINAGRDPATPAAIISWGTTDRQQVVRARLDSLAAATLARDLPTPAVIVIGAVAALADELAWFQPDGTADGFVE